MIWERILYLMGSLTIYCWSVKLVSTLKKMFIVKGILGWVNCLLRISKLLYLFFSNSKLLYLIMRLNVKLLTYMNFRLQNMSNTSTFGSTRWKIVYQIWVPIYIIYIIIWANSYIYIYYYNENLHCWSKYNNFFLPK